MSSQVPLTTRAGYTLFSTISDNRVKDAFTVTYTFLGVAITLFGSYFLRRRTLHKLNSKNEKDRLVTITEMTSWLSLTSALTYILKTRRLPGSGYGLLMILVGAFGLTHQLFVNNFIIPGYDNVENGCSFDSGVITTKMSGKLTFPRSTWAAASTVSNAQSSIAQSASLQTGDREAGLYGIWDKVDEDSTNFYPWLDDLVGKWACSPYDPNPNLSINASHYQTIAWVMLYDNQDFLFSNSSPTGIWVDQLDPQGNVVGILAVSANEPNTSTKTWDFRASILTNLSMTAAEATAFNIECKMSQFNSWTPPIMPSEWVLNEWLNSFYGSIMSLKGEADLYSSALELQLDAMSMVAGSDNLDTWWDEDIPDQQKLEYGCIVNVTAINYPVWILIGLMLLILIPMVIVDIFMIIFDLVKCGKEGPANRADLLKGGPLSGVDSWQVALLRHATNDHSIKADQLKDYSYGWHPVKEKFELNHRDTFKPATPTLMSQQSSNSSATKHEVQYSAVTIQSHELREV